MASDGVPRCLLAPLFAIVRLECFMDQSKRLWEYGLQVEIGGAMDMKRRSFLHIPTSQYPDDVTKAWLSRPFYSVSVSRKGC